MSNSATLSNNIKQELASISNSLCNVHYMIMQATACHDVKHTKSVLHSIAESEDTAEAIVWNAEKLSSAFASFRRKIMTVIETDHNDETSPLSKAMNRPLTPSTPTRRIAPIPIPNAPGKDKSLRPWYTWNSLTQKYHDDSEAETTLSIPDIEAETQVDDGRCQCRPNTPKPIEPETPIVHPATSPLLTDAINLDDYDMWGHPLWFYNGNEYIDMIGADQ